jgi:hypothetical protein
MFHILFTSYTTLLVSAFKIGDICAMDIWPGWKYLVFVEI